MANIYDIRKSRRFDPREVKAVIVDSNRFNRSLLSEIMRTIDVLEVHQARSEKDAIRILDEKRITVMLLEWSELNEMDSLALSERIRRMHDDFSRRVPIIAASSAFTKEQLVKGRNAGIDEFLKRPCSPNDVINRLKMVIETPRPFVDSKNYIGPCRRRKNPADYHGPRRRSEDDVNAVKQVSDEERDMLDKESEIGAAVVRLKMCCSLLLVDPKVGQARAAQAFQNARAAAESQEDVAFIRALSAFSKYIGQTLSQKQMERRVMQTGMSTLEQLVILPVQYTGARMTIAQAFEDAIERKLSA